jgi:hypothetical protein
MVQYGLLFMTAIMDIMDIMDIIGIMSISQCG